MASSATSTSHLPTDPDALLYPEGSVTEESVELLHEFAHPHHRQRTTSSTVGASRHDGPNVSGGAMDPETLNDDEEDINNEIQERMSRPWYRRPSPWWLLITMPFTAIAMSACAAPRVAIYTELACRVHRPDYSVGSALASHHDVNPAGQGLDTGVGFGHSYNFNMLDGMGMAASHLQIPYHPPLVVNNPDAVFHIAQDDAERQHQCAADPKVQAAVSKLIAVLTSTMGVLSCMTTAWWGSLSDRYGRLRVMSITVCGLLINDFNFIFVYWFVDRLPGNYWFLIVGPLIDGVFGGMTTGVAASHAYTADCTPAAARARIFSLSLGLLFIGMALGPTLGSFLIAGTGSALSVFYAATVWHICYSSLIWFVLPESLTRSAMMKSRRRYAIRLEEEEQKRRESEALGGVAARHRVGERVVRAVVRTGKRVFAFMSPLSVFAPLRDESFAKTGKRDWSLTFLALGFGFYTMVMASYQFKFQYAAATFNWTAEELGYWLSLVGGTRAAYLTLVLPVIIKLCTSNRSIPVRESVRSRSRHSSLVANDSTSALLSGRSRSPGHSRSRSPQRPAVNSTSATEKPRHSPLFNLNLARASLALEMVCYTLIPLAPTPVTFTLFSMLASCGGGFNPALQSLALDLFSRSGETESGRLFGALSVIQAISSQIVGPAIFSFTYVKTVSTYPKMIFFVSTAAVSLSFISLMFVRLQDPKDKQEYTAVPTDDHEDTA